jgi:hypothetical protein
MSASAPKIAAITAVTAGPAAAKRSSSPGFCGRPLILATPPSSHRSISSISTPQRRATSAWPNSCARMLANSNRTLASPSA